MQSKWQNLFTRAIAVGDYETAETACVRALQEDPEDAIAHFTLSDTLLVQKKFGPGWREWEWRRRHPGSKYLKHVTMFWNGMPLRAPLLVTVTEGYGDAIMFAAYLPWVAERCTGIVLACPAAFTSIAERLPGVIQVVNDLKDVPAVAAVCEISDLPMLLQLPFIPSPIHLDYPVEQTNKVGHCFKGNPGNSLKHIRDLPDDMKVRLLAHPVEWVDLDRQPEDNTIEDVARRTAQCRLVVATDNLRVHLAGALGVPCLVLLSKVADWRWFTGDDCAWYPQHVLIRQPSIGDWASVIDKAVAAL